MQIDMNGITSPELLQKEVEKMNSFGVRLTGTKAQRNFIKSIVKWVCEPMNYYFGGIYTPKNMISLSSMS